MERKLEVSTYGISLLSIDKFSEFLSSKKIKSKKILELLQKNHELYLESLKEGVWVPILPIDSIEYIIKIKNSEVFGEEWSEVFNVGSFNLEIGSDNSLWINSLGRLLTFDKNDYLNKEFNSYKTLDGEVLYNSFKINIEKGKYSVNVSGYKRKIMLEYPEANYGYSFEFNKVNEFESYNDPREDDKFKFNISKY